MEMSLNHIQQFIQSYVNIVSIVSKTDITVVDKNLIRIAGTSLYFDQIGQKISHANLYRKVLETGQPTIMTKNQHYNSCANCRSFNICSEMADIAYPIYYDNEVIGIISMIAFDQNAQNELMLNSANYIDFLKHISTLLESKLFKFVKVNNINNKNINIVDRPENSNKTEFISADPHIIEMLNIIRLTTNSDSTVLITGESGTGKEVLAKVIHQTSNRNNQPMVSLNCAAIPENLIESELFGYEKGSFTGANKEGQVGKFELANGGILFLDEIGEMPLFTQIKLLRVLQDKTIRRIGGKIDQLIDVRIVCATNQNLLQLIKEKKFRADLYYRINVIPFAIPPLRERKNDIPLLLNEFLQYFNQKFHKKITLSSQTIKYLKSYSWPGNVRELRNVVEYLINVNDNGVIKINNLPNYLHTDSNANSELEKPLKSIIKKQESQLLFSLVAKANTTAEKRELANKLGISISSLYRKMAEYRAR